MRHFDFTSISSIPPAMSEASQDDIPALAARLQRETMLALTQALNRPLMGLGSGGKALGLSTSARRKLREIDSLLDWVKKLSRPSINKFIADLRIEIAAASASCVPEGVAAPVHSEVSTGFEWLGCSSRHRTISAVRSRHQVSRQPILPVGGRHAK